MISFSSYKNTAHSEAMHLVNGCSALLDRVDELCDRVDFPPGWRPAQQVAALLMVASEPNRALVKNLCQRHLDAPERPFEKNISQTFLREMDDELDRVTQILDTRRAPNERDLVRGWESALRELRGEKLLGGSCCKSLNQKWIWGDALSTGTANAIGYLLGSVVQSVIENGFCDAQEHKLGYEKRIVAELGNRAVQHLVRFALRDVLFPWIKHRCGWHSLEMKKDMTAGEMVCANFLVIAPLMTGDQVGVALLTKAMGSVPLDEGRSTPEIWESGAQMMVFAGTDFLAWVAANYLTQWCYGAESKVNETPFKGLDEKAFIHMAQVAIDGLVLSGWKNEQDGLNPNRLCLPGIDTHRVQPKSGNFTEWVPLNATETKRAMNYNATHEIVPGASLRAQGRAPEYHSYAVILDAMEIATMLGVVHREGLLRIAAFFVARGGIPPIFPGAEYSHESVNLQASALDMRVEPEPGGGRQVMEVALSNVKFERDGSRRGMEWREVESEPKPHGGRLETKQLKSQEEFKVEQKGSVSGEREKLSQSELEVGPEGPVRHASEYAIEVKGGKTDHP